MKCIVCKKEGGSDAKGVITLQSTTMGSVCPKCIDKLVTVYMKGDEATNYFMILTEYWRR